MAYMETDDLKASSILTGDPLCGHWQCWAWATHRIMATWENGLSNALGFACEQDLGALLSAHRTHYLQSNTPRVRGVWAERITR